MNFGCSNHQNEESEKIDLSPNIYSFDHVYYPDPKSISIHFDDVLFLNKDCFLMIYYFNIEEYYIRGKYSVNENLVELRFEKTAYKVYFPEVPAISAPSETHNAPIVSEATPPFKKLKFLIGPNKSTIIIKANGIALVGNLNIDLTPEDYRFGLMNQELQFLLDLKTIRVE